MPRKPYAASRIVDSLSTNFTNQNRGLWITDALLAETFRNFCRTPRRYGSNVPGPLEARRRASKRKNTSLAYTGGGGQMVYDPAIMLGSGPKDQWWKRVERNSDDMKSGYEQERAMAAATSFLPEWLFKLPTTLTPPDSTCQETSSSNEVPEIKNAQNIQHMKAEFADRIKQTRTFKKMVAIIEKMGVNLRFHPELSHIAFQRLMEVCQEEESYEKLGKALYDPLLHPPGSNNHLFLLRHLSSHGISQRQRDTSIWPPLLKAIELGLVSPSDLQEIITIIPDIAHVPKRAHILWLRILRAIEESRVLRVDDLDKDKLHTWYQQIANAKQTDITCKLLWRLHKYSGCSEIESATEKTIRRLKEVVKKDSGATEEFTEWFASLPVNVQGPVVIQATFKMISAAQNNQSLAGDILEEWSSILPQLGSEAMMDLPVNKTTWSKASVVPCSLTAPQQLLSVIWILTRLWESRPRKASHFATMDLRDEFESTFANIADVEEYDHVSRIVLTLDTLPLPGKDQIFPFLEHFTAESLIKMLGHGHHLDTLRGCLRLDYAELKDNSFAWVARHRFPHVLNAVGESINEDLMQFQAMAQTLILKSSENFRIVRRLIDYNLDLRFTIFHSWPSSPLSQTTRNSEPKSRPRLMLAMLENIIMTYAVTPIITPRASFRHVYKMYLFLHKCNAPINPIVGRALWHSGVTRYGQKGAPRSQVEWCLSKVREIEGEEAAQRLLWSAGFRRSFIEDFAIQVERNPFIRSAVDAGIPRKPLARKIRQKVEPSNSNPRSRQEDASGFEEAERTAFPTTMFMSPKPKATNADSLVDDQEKAQKHTAAGADVPCGPISRSV